MAGANIFNGYSSYIFKEIEKKSGAVGTFNPTEGGYFIGTSGFIGGILGIFTVPFFSRRAILIGGHFLMGMFLGMVAFFINDGKPDMVLICISMFNIIF